MLARRGARFARILGADDPMGWDAAGPADARAVSYINKTNEAPKK